MRDPRPDRGPEMTGRRRDFLRRLPLLMDEAAAGHVPHRSCAPRGHAARPGGSALRFYRPACRPWMGKMTDYGIWSYEHQQWWAPDRRGYTPDVHEAGRYTEAEAEEIVAGAYGRRRRSAGWRRWASRPRPSWWGRRKGGGLRWRSSATRAARPTQASPSGGIGRWRAPPSTGRKPMSDRTRVYANVEAFYDDVPRRAVPASRTTGSGGARTTARRGASPTSTPRATSTPCASGHRRAARSRPPSGAGGAAPVDVFSTGHGDGPVIVLGRLAPFAGGPRRADPAEALLDGWADECGRPGSLAWVMGMIPALLTRSDPRWGASTR